MAYRRTPLMLERMADTRQRILRAARRLIASGGFREASIAAIANEVGLSTGAIYRYFPSKAELFVEVLSDAVTREIEILDEIVARPAPATERLSAAVESFAVRALQGPHLAFAFIAEPIDPEVDAERIVCRKRFGNVFQKILQDGVASGEFWTASAEVSAACLVGAFTEALTGPTAAQWSGQARENLIENIVTFCVRAVLAPQRPAVT